MRRCQRTLRRKEELWFCFFHDALPFFARKRGCCCRSRAAAVRSLRFRFFFALCPCFRSRGAVRERRGGGESIDHALLRTRPIRSRSRGRALFWRWVCRSDDLAERRSSHFKSCFKVGLFASPATSCMPDRGRKSSRETKRRKRGLLAVKTSFVTETRPKQVLSEFAKSRTTTAPQSLTYSSIRKLSLTVAGTPFYC